MKTSKHSNILNRIFNQERGEGAGQISLRNIGKGHIANVTNHSKGGKESQIFAKNSVT